MHLMRSYAFVMMTVSGFLTPQEATRPESLHQAATFVHHRIVVNSISSTSNTLVSSKHTSICTFDLDV